jgi:hypothetical protein
LTHRIPQLAAAILVACVPNPDRADEDDSSSGAEDSSSSATLTTTETMTDDSSEATTPTESTTESESESSSTTTPVPACVESSECTDAAAPVCMDDVCVPCDEAPNPNDACVARDPAAGVCREQTGQCVQCSPEQAVACGTEAPICAAAALQCRGCAEHAECGDACEYATGECFEEEGGECWVALGDGDSIQDAIDAVDDGGRCTLVLLENGATDFNESFTVDAGKRIALVASGPDVVVQGVSGGTMAVTAGAQFYVRGALVRGNPSGPGMTASGAGTQLFADATRVVNNTGGGITLSAGADGHLRNCFVGGNVSDVSALQVTSSSADVLYSTIIAAQQFEEVAALRCSGAVDVTVRNSILAMAGADPEIACAGADATYSGTESNPRHGKRDARQPHAAWFVTLGNDFHLNNLPADVLTTAQWQLGDPSVDIDGDLRPTEDGAFKSRAPTSRELPETS